MPTIVMFVAVLGIWAGNAVGAEVFKWVDKQGNVHFGDQPSDSSAAKITVQDSAADSATLERIQRQKEYLNARTEERADAKVQAAEDQKKNEQRAADCAKLKTNLSEIQARPRLYRHNDKGERVYLSGPERDAEIANTQKLLAEHCQ